MRFAFISCALALGILPASSRMDADLAFVRETEAGRREAFIVTDGVERALDPGPWQSYPAVASANGALALLRVDDEGTTLLAEGRTIARAGTIRSPAFAPDGSGVAFESDARGFRDLHLATSTVTRQLTHDPEGDFEPSFFPDGRSIAFTSSRDGQTEIYRQEIGRANAVRLTNAPSEDFAPRVSPDGSQIAFLTGRSGHDRVWLMNADGSHARPLRSASPEQDEREHVWSPDGSRLAFVARTSGQAARVMMFDVATERTVAITDESVACDMPAFAPDGQRIAFVASRNGIPDVVVANVDGTNAKRVAKEPARRWRPVWIPKRAKERGHP